MITDPESVLPNNALMYVRDAAAFTECKNPTGATYDEVFDHPDYGSTFPVVGYEVPWSFIDKHWQRTNWDENYDENARRWFEERGKIMRELHHEPLIFQFIGSSGGDGRSYTVFDILYLNINARIYSVWDRREDRKAQPTGHHYIFAWDTPVARQALTALRLLT